VLIDVPLVLLYMFEVSLYVLVSANMPLLVLVYVLFSVAVCAC
jgi:hypothetical protein